MVIFIAGTPCADHTKRMQFAFLKKPAGWGLIGIIIVCVVWGGITLFSRENKGVTSSLPEQEIVQTAQNESAAVEDGTEWLTYQDDKNGYRIQYPSNWSMKVAASEPTFTSPRTTSKIQQINIRIRSLGRRSPAEAQTLWTDTFQCAPGQKGAEWLEQHPTSKWKPFPLRKEVFGDNTYCMLDDSLGGYNESPTSDLDTFVRKFVIYSSENNEITISFTVIYHNANGYIPTEADYAPEWERLKQMLTSFSFLVSARQ